MHFHLVNKRCAKLHVLHLATVNNNNAFYILRQEMFSLCLVEPWDEQLIALTVEINAEGWITLTGFLAFWT